MGSRQQSYNFMLSDTILTLIGSRLNYYFVLSKAMQTNDDGRLITYMYRAKYLNNFYNKKQF